MDEQGIQKESFGNGFQDLVCRSQSGDCQAFAEIVRLLAPRIYGLAFSFLRNHQDAEDVSQEAFIKAFKHIKSFDRSRSLEAWLLTIVANEAKNKLRWKRLRERITFSMDRWKDSEDQEPIPTEIAEPRKKSDPAELIGQSHGRAQLWNTLSSLPEQQRLAIHLKFIEGCKISEVAKIMEISEGTVKTHIFRGLEKLKKMLDEKDYELP